MMTIIERADDNHLFDCSVKLSSHNFNPG